jgi:hypothetical protein
MTARGWTAALASLAGSIAAVAALLVLAPDLEVEPLPVERSDPRVAQFSITNKGLLPARDLRVACDLAARDTQVSLVAPRVASSPQRMGTLVHHGTARASCDLSDVIGGEPIELGLLAAYRWLPKTSRAYFKFETERNRGLRWYSAPPPYHADEIVKEALPDE